jgi:hypothetical protein
MSLPSSLLALAIAAIVVGGCAAPPRAQPGDTAAQLATRLPPPDAKVPLPGGGERWQYPTGPLGVEAYMIDFASDGRVLRVTQVLTVENLYATLQPGMSYEEVRAALGRPAIEMRFPNLAQDVWTWRFFDIGDLNPFRQLDVFFSVQTGRLAYYTMTPDRAFDPSAGGDRP